MSGQRPWFRRKTFGYGWTPQTWQGWLITIASAAVVIAINLALVRHFTAR